MALKDLKLDDEHAVHTIYISCKTPFQDEVNTSIEIAYNEDTEAEGKQVEKPGWFIRILGCSEETLITSKNMSAKQLTIKLKEYLSFLSIFNGNVTNITKEINYDNSPTDTIAL